MQGSGEMQPVISPRVSPPLGSVHRGCGGFWNLDVKMHWALILRSCSGITTQKVGGVRRALGSSNGIPTSVINFNSSPLVASIRPYDGRTIYPRPSGHLYPSGPAGDSVARTQGLDPYF
jgi:hypothetical protein